MNDENTEFFLLKFFTSKDGEVWEDSNKDREFLCLGDILPETVEQAHTDFRHHFCCKAYGFLSKVLDCEVIVCF